MSFSPVQVTYPNTAGPRASYGHIEVKIAGFAAIGLKSANYSRTREVEDVYGTHPDPIGTTLGTNKYECEVEIYFEEYQSLLATVVAAASSQNVGYGDYYFSITVTYNVPGAGTVTDTIQGCRLLTTAADNAQGNAALARKVSFKPLKILFNGIDDVTNPLPQLAIFQSVTTVAALAA